MKEGTLCVESKGPARPAAAGEATTEKKEQTRQKRSEQRGVGGAGVFSFPQTCRHHESTR